MYQIHEIIYLVEIEMSTTCFNCASQINCEQILQFQNSNRQKNLHSISFMWWIYIFEKKTTIKGVQFILNTALALCEIFDACSLTGYQRWCGRLIYFILWRFFVKYIIVHIFFGFVVAIIKIQWFFGKHLDAFIFFRIDWRPHTNSNLILPYRNFSTSI